MYMSSPKITNRDKKMIIVNFMEELCKKYKNAAELGLSTKFILNDFYNTDIFEKYLPEVGIEKPDAENLIFKTLREYEKGGYYKIEENNIMLCERGIAICQNRFHNWA
jgi:hypothetical protein